MIVHETPKTAEYRFAVDHSDDDGDRDKNKTRPGGLLMIRN